ncbi:MAG: hypothetical protein IJF56_02970 [Clostridia bacterium]|nr:hypothetical protein [Clostridia bacterium]
MKKKRLLKCAGILLLLLTLLSFTGCAKNREKAYYSDTNHFITEEAVVENISYTKKFSGNRECIVLWLSEIDEAYQSSNFNIEGENVALALERGILDKVEEGDVITYTSAPGFFYNGDFMPIVALSVDSEEILCFEEGYRNLMDLY